MSGMDRSKTQRDEILSPNDLSADTIVSPDTRREKRVPPGQSRTKKWPVLDASGPPAIDLERWRFRIAGLTGRTVEWTWKEFEKLPRVKVFADFHCVTRWSRLGNLWEGVSTRELLERAGGALPQAHYVLVHGFDRGWDTNLPLADFATEDALVALLHDGEPISMDGTAHRPSPVRLEERQVGLRRGTAGT
jgi:DMSO/TMAO reductase YedYZ molybdopterin-dependent catalytic subunit